MALQWDPVLGSQPDPWLDGRFFVYDGELIHNTGCLVDLPANAFCQTSNQLLFRTVAALKAAFAGDMDLCV